MSAQGTKKYSIRMGLAMVAMTLFFAGRAVAALAVDSTSSASSATAVNALAWDHTTNAATTGQNTLLVVGVSIAGTSTVSSVTIGADPATYTGAAIGDSPIPLTLASATNSPNGQAREEIWYVLAPPVTGTTAGSTGSEPFLQIKVTLSGGATASMTAGAVFFTGAMQVAPTAWTATNGTTTPASISGTSNATDIVVGTVASVGTATSLTAGAGQTSRWSIVTGAGTANAAGAGATETGATSMSWTLGANADWAMGAVAIQASANSRFTVSLINMDDLYGIDSNNPATSGPYRSPIGIHVTNTGAALTDVSITAQLFDTPSICGASVNLPCVVLNNYTYTSQSIPAGGSFDYYFILAEDHSTPKGKAGSSINTAFSFVITVHSGTVSATDDETLSSGMELVLDLTSQNRNATNFTSCNGVSTVTGSKPGSILVSVPQNSEFTCVVTSTSTGSGAFGTMRIWQDWDGINFHIDKVTTNYTAANQYSPPSPDCYNSGCGGSGVTYTQTLVLRAVGAVGGPAIVVTPFILDDSGGSHHYNSGAGITATITITNPTAVRLRSFDAVRRGNDVLLNWRTGYETQNLGYRIHRENPDGSKILVTPGLVAGSALMTGPEWNLTSGDSYAFVDRNAPEGSQYWLEDVDLDGTSTEHGPAVPENASASEGGPRAEVASSPLLSDLNAAVAGTGSAAPAGFGAARGEATWPVSSPEAKSLQFALAGKKDMKLLVSQEGWYRFTRQDLANAGWDPGSFSENLQLYAEGQPVPMLVTRLSGGNYSMEFYGTGIDTPYTGTRVYWLARSTAPGTRIVSESGASGTAGPESFPFTVESKDRVVYAPGIMSPGTADGWYGPIIGPSGFPAAQASLIVNNLDSSGQGSAVLQVAFMGATTADAHTVDVSVNGNPAGTASFTGETESVFQFPVPLAWLSDGTNAVQVTGENQGYALLQDVQLTYPHVFSADQDALQFTSDGSTRVTIGGFTTPNIRVLDITNPSSVALLASTVAADGAGGYAVTAASPSAVGTVRLLAIGDDRIASPGFAANAPSRLHSAQNGANLVIIAHPDFAGAMAPLASLRQSQGLRTMVVDVTDIYDEYNYGEKSAQAIKDFLTEAKTSWHGTPLRYVLLAGDGSFDPRGYLTPYGIANSDFVPIELINGALQKTASDDWFVDFNGDGLPDLPIGRLPVDTAGEASTVVSKIVGYDRQSPSPNVLLVADQNDENDFEGAVSGLAPLVTNGYAPQTLLLGQVGASATHTGILAGFDAGDSVINWVGHGEQTSWSQQDVFDATDVPSLANASALPLVLAMDCLNGYFHDPTKLSLAEQLLEAPNGGAVAVWASTTLTNFAAQVPVNQALFQQLFHSGTPTRLGDAMVFAKGATNDTDVRRTWTLFGDPTMILR